MSPLATPNFDEAVAQADRGNGVLTGESGGTRVVYLQRTPTSEWPSRSSAAPRTTAHSRTRSPDLATNPTRRWAIVAAHPSSRRYEAGGLHRFDSFFTAGGPSVRSIRCASYQARRHCPRGPMTR